MWECPDFFPLGDEGLYVLMFSPMGLGERKTVYLVGEMDFKTGSFPITYLAKRIGALTATRHNRFSTARGAGC